MSDIQNRIENVTNILQRDTVKIQNLPEYLDTSDATATATDISEGITAYVNGVKITGTMENLSNVISEQENIIANLQNIVNDKAGLSFQIPDGIKFAFSTVTSISDFNTSNVTDMSQMFEYCSNLASVSNLNTSKVTDMSAMFDYCTKLTSAPNLDTSNVTNMNYMFSQCNRLRSVPEYNTSKVADMSGMFQCCNDLVDVSIQNIVNMCINSDVTNIMYKNLSNSNLYSPLYNTVFDNSYYSDRLDELNTAGWTY